MQWLQSVFGGQSVGITLLLLVLGLAIALVLLFWVFRKIAGNGEMRAGKNRQPRLSVTDAAAVDDKRRLVLVRRDDVEHLVMIGGASDILIEANITVAQPAIPTTSPKVREPSPQPAETERAKPAKTESAAAAPVAVASVSADPVSKNEAEPNLRTPDTMSTIEEIRERAAASESHSSAAPVNLEKQASTNPAGAQQEAAVHEFPQSKDTSIAEKRESFEQSQESSLERELQHELADSTSQQHPVDPRQPDAEPRTAPSIDVAERSSSQEERKRKASALSGNKEVEDEMQKLLDELANS